MYDLEEIIVFQIEIREVTRKHETAGNWRAVLNPALRTPQTIHGDKVAAVQTVIS